MTFLLSRLRERAGVRGSLPFIRPPSAVPFSHKREKGAIQVLNATQTLV
jgi:hypothetical protein